MAILGLILVAIAIGGGVELALSNRTEVGGEAFGYTAASATPMAFLLLGALLALVGTLGLLLITGSMERRRRRGIAVHSDAADSDASIEELMTENERLRNELIEERRQRETLGGVAVPPGVGDVPYGDQIGEAARSMTISDTGRFDPYPEETRRAARVDTEAEADTRSPRHARRS